MDSTFWFAAGLVVGEAAMIVALIVGEAIAARAVAHDRAQWAAEDARPSAIPPHEPDVDDIASEESVDRYLDYMERRARTRHALNRSH